MEKGLDKTSRAVKERLRYLEESDVARPGEEGDVGGRGAGAGVLVPMTGGRRENLDVFAGSAVHVEEREGAGVFAALDQYASTDPADLPDVFDVLGCSDGCLMASAAQCEPNPFKLYKQLQQARRNPARHIEANRERLAADHRPPPLADSPRA